jgi:ribosome-associated protein
LNEAAAAPLLPLNGQAPDGGSLVHVVLNCLDEAKAEEATFIDLQGKTSIADGMVVATGRSSVHVSAIADRLLRALKQAGVLPRVEGLTNGDWVLIDAGDVIIHVFRPEVRQFYNLEKMWGADRPMLA